MTKHLPKLDERNKRILRALVQDSNRSYRALAKDLGMSTTALIDRVRALEESDIITGYGARFDYLRLGFDFMGIVEINISGRDLIAVEKKIAILPHVAAVWDTTGEYDALAIVMCKNRAELSVTVKKILSIGGVEKTNTNIVLNVVKGLADFDGV